MARVYVQGELQSNPIKLEERSDSINVSFAMPTTAKYVIPFVYKNILYVQNARKVYRWTTSGWEDTELSESITLGNTNTLAAIFAGAVGNKMFFISKDSNVYEVTISTTQNSITDHSDNVPSAISSVLSSISRPNPTWSLVYNNKIHIMGYSNKHLVFDPSNQSWTDLSSTDTGLNTDYLYAFLNYKNKFIALGYKNSNSFVLEYNESTHVWTEVLNGYDADDLDTFIGSLSDARKMTVCTDEYDYIHRAGTIEGYSTDNYNEDHIFSIADDYSSSNDWNYNVFSGNVPGGIIDFNGFIWIFCGYAYNNASSWSSRVIRIDNTARLQYAQDWQSSIVKKYYKIVSSTIYIKGVPISYNAAGQVVSGS